MLPFPTDEPTMLHYTYISGNIMQLGEETVKANVCYKIVSTRYDRKTVSKTCEEGIGVEEERSWG